MGDQPSAGGPHSYKIRGHSRQRRSAKPYARPSEHKKGVLETVKDFFSPSWLVDFWKGKGSTQEGEVEKDIETDDRLSDTTTGIRDSSDRDYDAQTAGVFEGSSANTGESRSEIFGNGGLGSIHTRGRSKGKNALSTFLASKSSYRTTRETTTIRESENEGTSETLSRQDEVHTESEATSTSTGNGQVQAERVEIQERPSSSADQPMRVDDRSPGISPYLNPGPSRQAMPSSFLTSTPMPGTSGLCGTSSMSGTSGLSGKSGTSGSSLHTPGMSSTPLNVSRTPAPTPSASLLLFGQPTGAKAKQTSAFKTKPAFSVTAFGSPLPPRPRSQVSMHPYASPFYSGRTSFGGSASQRAGTKRMRVSSPRTAEINQPVKKQIKPTQVAASGSGGVASQTAKRILEALERMSTPLIDAKKIPPSPPFSTSTSPLSFTTSQRIRPPPASRAVGSPRKLKAQFSAPPVQVLSVPQRASISRIQTRTTPHENSPAGTSTAMMTESTTASTSGLSYVRGTTTSTSTISKPLPAFIPTPLPMSLSPDIPTTRVGGKMKRDRSTAHYTSGRSSRMDEEEETEPVNPIPEVTAAVPLQLQSGKSLPTFSFSSSSVTTTKTGFVPPVLSKSQDITKNNFKFSAPAPKASTSSLSSTKKSIVSTQAFSFSQPAPVKANETNKDSASSSLTKPSFIDKFKPVSDSWECETCMINNKATDTKCLACETPKPAANNSTSSASSLSNSLLNKFTPPSNSWTCDTCLISNKDIDNKCVACQSPKPSAAGSVPAKPVMLKGDKGDGADELRKKFASSEGTWECDTCMLNNKARDVKCVSCETPKPGAKTAATVPSFGTPASTLSTIAKFTSAAGSWTCDTCMIVNKPELVKCLACETPKPGAMIPEPAGGSFKLTSGSSFTSSPFRFGSKESDSGSKPTVRFGAVPSNDSSKPSFQFGAPTSKDSTVPIIKFDRTPATTDSTPATSDSTPEFRFGAPASKDITAPIVKFGAGPTTESTSTIQFGSSASANEVKAVPQSESQATPAFKFGADTSAAKPTAVTFGSTSASAAKKPSIAAAAASGFLTVPGISTPTTGENKQGGTSQGAQPSISDPTKAGFLTIPTSGEPVPPNVNLFASAPTATSDPPPYPGNLASIGDNPAFSKLDSIKTEPAKPATFTFTGAGSTGSNAPLPTLGSTSAAVPAVVTPQLGFTTGAGTSNQALGNTTTASSNPLFGFTATATSTSAPTGFAPSTAAPTAAAQPFAFGANTGSFSFNGATTAASNLGGSTATTLPTSTPGSFGFSAVSTGATTSSSSVPFVFGAAPAPSAPGAATFAFNSAGSSSASQKPAFSGFAAPTQPFAFGGGASVTPSVSEESMDADGNNNSNQQVAAVPAVLGGAFGAAPAVPAPGGFPFGQPAANTGFNFSASQQQQSMFKFGAAQTAAPAPTPAQFALGVTAAPGFGSQTSQPPAAAIGGFNFLAAPPSTNSLGTPAPSFNFSAGSGPIGGFSAGVGDSGTPATKRVIKRGVRRSRKT